MRHRTLSMLFVGLVFGVFNFAQAATITVTTNADSGAGSLREAITIAEGNGEVDEIIFDADYTIALSSVLPTISTEITITGNGWNNTIIDGGNPAQGTSGVRAFYISTGNLTLDDVMIQNCYAWGGSAVYNESGTLSVISSSLETNASNSAVYGGAIYSESSNPIDLELSRFEDNLNLQGGPADVTAIGNTSTPGQHLGITDTSFFNGSGDSSILVHWKEDLVVESSTFYGASEKALDILGCTGTISNSTLSENQTAIEYDSYNVNWGPVNITGVTILDSDSYGIRIFGSSTQVALSHTIIADSGIANCVVSGGTLTSVGNNLDSANTCSFASAGDLINTNPLLGPLQDNGGPTFTHQPLLSSPAIDAGLADSGLAVDQRGISRPQDGDGNTVALCDIGAVESGTLIFADGFESGDVLGWDAVVPSGPQRPSALRPRLAPAATSRSRNLF
ncbi:MAG: hypothetical protein GY906_33410 [bacterium]|nr:hypothetical protein [bacterium]